MKNILNLDEGALEIRPVDAKNVKRFLPGERPFTSIACVTLSGPAPGDSTELNVYVRQATTPASRFWKGVKLERHLF